MKYQLKSDRKVEEKKHYKLVVPNTKEDNLITCQLCEKDALRGVNLSNGCAVHPACVDLIQKECEELENKLGSVHLKCASLRRELENQKKISSRIISLFKSPKIDEKLIGQQLSQLSNDESTTIEKIDKLQQELRPIYDYYLDYPPDWQVRRSEVLKRDDKRCVECHSGINLHVHHIAPLSKGGSNLLSNLETLCEGCHSKEHGGRRFTYDESKKTESHFSKRVSLIKKAIKENDKVEFYYRKPLDSKSQKRVVLPSELISIGHVHRSGQTLCMRGYCEVRSAERTFAIKRISRIKIK